MNIQIAILLLTLFIVLLSFINYFQGQEKTVLETRKKQSKNLFRENVIKQRIDEIIEKRVDYSKQHKIETLCLQAGYQLKYSEYVLISAITGIVSGFLFGFVMKNIIVGIFFFFIGYTIPKQMIKFVKNRRVNIIEQQVGPFLEMVTKRYEVTKDFRKALEMTKKEFVGEQPIYDELEKTCVEIQLGKPVEEALEGLARRTGNKFLTRLCDYYKVTSVIGTDDVRKNLLRQAYLQYQEYRETKQKMKKELSGMKKEAYIVTGMIPAVILFSISVNNEYVSFMTQTTMGKIGTAFIVSVFIGTLWFINNKINAPLE